MAAESVTRVRVHQTWFRILAARRARDLPFESLENRGRRECRAPSAPAASYAKVKSIRVSHHGHTGSPGIPYAMVLTGSFALSPVTGLVCHRRQRSCLRQLDASVGASGPHDFAVRVRAIRQARSPRPPHPVPYVRDDRETSLCVGQDSTRYRADLGLRKIRIFLQKGLDTTIADLPSANQRTGLA